ncbi:LacI family DNA-binding transcriptional regulator [Tsukamurella paurometabola]|uniref:LacI family DNA-binding transcriptional regulator n=2 Tax=Tsukamurella paurometabola TaxID=2061 RepID=A0ABS5NBA4_TSUPA|nr:LacI family DNA-binding transcriptional regulator [Tsukamurella paurometabola]
MATMADVARLAGVSRSTVSYVLSGDRPISAETRERVLAAMEALDYAPNVLARALAGTRTGLLGLLLTTEALGQGVDTAGYVTAAADEARALGSHLMLLPGPADDADPVRETVRQGLVDGFAVMEVYTADARVDYLRAAGVPFVLVGRTDDVEGTAFCDADFDAAAEEAVAHLTGKGHRELAVLTGPAVDRARAPGFAVRSSAAVAAAVRRHGARARVVPTAATFAGGWDAYAGIAAGPATAVLLCNEPAGLGMISAAAAAGVRIPQELSVVTVFAGTETGELTRPRLTSIGPDHTAMARRAIRFLLRRVAGEPAAELQSLSEPVLLDRGSTAAPRPTLPGAGLR